ncbi:MAG: DUF1648 domain-containing protein [Bacteroidota bacterium]
MDQRPKLKVKKEPLDWLIEIIGFLVLAAATTYVLLNYSVLPDRIPTHYDLDGNPDGFGNKSKLLILLTVTVSMFVALLILNRFPYLFNYPTTVTAENAPKLYGQATRMMRSLNTVIVLAFSYLIYSTIQTAFNSQDGLGNYFTPVLLMSVFGLIIYYLVKTIRTGKSA